MILSFVDGQPVLTLHQDEKKPRAEIRALRKAARIYVFLNTLAIYPMPEKEMISAWPKFERWVLENG